MVLFTWYIYLYPFVFNLSTMSTMFSASYFWLMSFLKISSFSFVCQWESFIISSTLKDNFFQVSSSELTVSFFSTLNLSFYFLLFSMNSKENTIIIILFFLLHIMQFSPSSTGCSQCFLFVFSAQKFEYAILNVLEFM